MKSKISKWLSIAIPILLGVGIIVYQYNRFSEAQINEIIGYFKNANYYFVVLAVFIGFLGNALRAYRWKYMLDHLGYESNFQNNFMAVNIGYLLNLTVPKSGEISRALIVKKYNNIPFDKGFGTIVAERIIDMFFLLFFMLLAVLLQFKIVKAFIIDKIPIHLIVLLLIIGILFLVAFILIYKYSKLKIVALFKEKISGLKEGLLSIFHMEKKWIYLFQTVVIWLSYLATYYFATKVIPETSTLSIGPILISFVVGSIAIAFTNSGFGAYPFLTSKVLLFYAIAEPAGTAFGWIIWTSQMLLLLLLGLVSFLFLPILNRK
ncbi:lysylphosphatidylglycerol synthase transmembrane domain-containing protein [Flavobacterium sp. SUN052]|uniref:lysylphosphatidylglycerol synthase transmembrane domain-containing protein n=1 Tax=Flavobacterium sp. SUN052 TaxID=3002441 RepID=UPI00237E182C|nr:lysylphosphatidylglycerol synthase transmembrane domain-containing protein [Flavobacterium sp. SUN052]MEC4003328.1 lysylphosphatidylglycerol synthase transmembrane domain-containing protein [Flavobacterium sp. SUN052]